MPRIIDFDAFRAEQKHEPVFLKIGGTTFEMSPTLPASVAIDVVRLKHDIDDSKEVPVEALQAIGEAVFGAEIWERLLREQRLTVNEIPSLIIKVIEIYSSEDDEEVPPKASTRRTRRSKTAS